MDCMPIGWVFDSRDRYRCMCRNFRTYSAEEIDTHIEPNGYCSYGLKCNSINEYVCICGKVFTKGYDAWNHVEDQIIGKFASCMKSYKSYCTKCNIQLQSIAAYKIHCSTKGHIQPREDSCTYCNVKYRGRKQKETHLASAKHTQRVEQGTLPLTCDVCQIKCKGQKEMKAHLETNKHKKNLTCFDCIGKDISC